ncbi:galactose mutarotase-like protein [Thozetella sp. PMI_491]|nr:galactose mutarotase-like protein [Thozetella sp. PMI_491]
MSAFTETLSAVAGTADSSQVAQVCISDARSCVSATLPTGESVQVLLFGAHVISWKDKNGVEKLWLSQASKLDGSEPIRGGIPLVFPVFMTSPEHNEVGKLPHHGLARISKWRFLGQSACGPVAGSEARDVSVKLDFGLIAAHADPTSRELWPFSFSLVYSVTLTQNSLTTRLTVTNADSRAFEFRVLMHTYLRVNNIGVVQVEGLDGAEFVDTIDGGKVKTQSRALSVTGETGNIYTLDEELPVTVVEGGTAVYHVHRDNLREVVVWNPWTDRAISLDNFGPKDGFKNMICIEPGTVREWLILEPGRVFEGAQTIVSV